MKKCPKCNIEKELLEFNSQKTRCLICHRIAAQLWRDNNLEKNREIQKDYTKNRRCKNSQTKHSKSHYRRNKKRIIDKVKVLNKVRHSVVFNTIVDYLLLNACVDCGEKNPLKLTFDHVRGNKEFNISDSFRVGYSLEKIFLEIEKCEVRCFNCHMEKTAIERGYITYKILRERNII